MASARKGSPRLHDGPGRDLMADASNGRCVAIVGGTGEGCTNHGAVAGADFTFRSPGLWRTWSTADRRRLHESADDPLGGKAIDAIDHTVAGSASGVASSLLPDHVRLVAGLHTAAARSLRTSSASSVPTCRSAGRTAGSRSSPRCSSRSPTSARWTAARSTSRASSRPGNDCFDVKMTSVDRFERRPYLQVTRRRWPHG